VKWLFTPLVVLVGLSNPVQSATNTQIQKVLGNVVCTTILIYAVALAGLVIISPFMGLHLRAGFEKVGSIPWWAWLGGLCNLIFLVTGAVATKQVRSGTYTIVTLVSAVILSLLLDQYGALDLREHPITIWRAVGGAMAISGAILGAF
jgi:transporter family-2 protein